MGGQRHASTALPPGKRPGAHCTGDWVFSRAGVDGCGKSRIHRYSIPPTVQPVASRSACPTCLVSLIKNTNYEAPHCAVFLVPVLLCLMS